MDREQQDLLQAVRRRLDASVYGEIRQLQCEIEAGVEGERVVLWGKVSSYYLKQMAQEAIRNGCCIVNRVQVRNEKF
jgi:hypothetical protein